jgi:hypothetical protein
MKIKVCTQTLGAVMISLTGTVMAAELSPPAFPPKGCIVETENGVVPGSRKPQKFTIAEGSCGGIQFGWLLSRPLGFKPMNDNSGTPLKLLDTIQLPHLRDGEVAEFIGGACHAGNKPIMKNMLVHARWGSRRKISATTGIIRAWIPDTKTGKFVDTPIGSITCEETEP